MCKCSLKQLLMRRNILVLLVAFLCLLANAANPRERALAQAIKSEAETLRKEVKGLTDAMHFDRAISILQKRGNSWLRLYGAKSWPMAEVSSMLAGAYLACGSACDKEEEAIELFEKSASVKLLIHGEQSPEYAEAIENTADVLVKARSYRRAMPYFKKLVKEVAANLGANHEALRNVRMKLADCAMRAKEYKVAKKSFLKLLRDKLLMEHVSAPSEVVSQEADVRLQLAVAMAHMAENEAGLEQIEAAKQLVARYFGRLDMRYAKLLNGAAGVMERLNRDEDALRNMEESSDTVTRLLGPKDPSAVQARINVEGLRRTIRSKSHRI